MAPVPTVTAPPTIRFSRRIGVVAAVVLASALVAAATWWLTHADERRVNAACDTYLQHQGSLRLALSEADEATERAIDARAKRVEDQYFNDADKVRSRVDQWLLESPSVIDDLGHDKTRAALNADRCNRSRP